MEHAKYTKISTIPKFPAIRYQEHMSAAKWRDLKRSYAPDGTSCAHGQQGAKQSVCLFVVSMKIVRSGNLII